MRRAAFALAVAALACASPARAETPPADAFDAVRVPEALRAWIPWVEPEDRSCPMLAGLGAAHCTWGGPLALEVDAQGARFAQRFEVYGRGAWVTLPGDAALRPLDVRVDGQPLPVVANDAPTAWLPAGRHAVEGRLVFASRPALLPVPATTALVSLVLDGAPVPLVTRDASGGVWLEARAAEPAPEDALDVLVFRRVVDEVPLELETRLVLRAAGRPREVAIGPVLPDGFVPLAVDASVAARLESDGRVRAQIRPGEHTIAIRARRDGRSDAIVAPAPPPPWAAEEVWVYDARPALRIASVAGVDAIDPSQTEVPPEWRSLPAYVLRSGDALELVEQRRGDPDPADDLALDRTFWLDFDGGGVTFRDTIEGRMRQATRLEMPAPSSLGRVAIGGRDWFLTRLDAESATGVEVPAGALALAAEGRIEAVETSALPAVGWSRDMDRVSARLALPPGWLLLHASGADRAEPSWVTSWTLLDFFLVLVTAAAALRLFGARTGVLALVALVLTWIEPAAPTLVWIGVLAAEAGVRVLGTRRVVGPAAQVLRGLLWAALALHVIPYAIDEMRRGIHLAHRPSEVGTLGRMPEAPAASSDAEYATEEAARFAEGGESVAMEEEIAVPAPRAVTPESVVLDATGKRVVLAAPPPPPKRPRDLRALDPEARIPTGPGIPTWDWRSVSLSWSGPVRADQTLHLWLVSPFGSRVLSFARVLLLAALVSVLLRGAAPAGGARSPAAAGVALALAVLGPLLAVAPARAAEFPPQELLEALRERIAAPPACAPRCASIARLAVEVREDRLRLRLEAHASVASGLPLPDGELDEEGFRVESVVVDARASDALHRLGAGELWLALAPGVHEVLIEARIAPAASRVEIALPFPPGDVAIDAPGWSAEGLDAQGRAVAAVSLRRDAAGGASAPPSLQPAPPPFFARVERTLVFDVAWRVETRVERLSAPGQAAVLDVPLLEGEALATEGIPVQDGRARVAFADDTQEVAWSSTLAPRPALELRAPAAASWVESWRLAVEPVWHVEAEGIAPIAVDESDPAPLRTWRPWPGESLALSVRRPAGVGGATLTIDDAAVTVTPGLRARDVALDVALRSTQGGRHTIVLPEGVALRRVAVDGLEQPIRAEGRDVSLPIRPGAQTVRLEWRSDEPMDARIAIPEVALGAPAVNLLAAIEMPENRWILAVRGPRLGPAVLFWSVLFVLVLVAWGLSRVRRVPLRFHQWLLLGLGLTQVPVWMGALVAGWLFALAWRRDRGASLAPLAFDAVQIALALATAVAIAVLFAAIRQGLLGAPEMQIAGFGSSARLLRWYQDRSAGGLPSAGVLSVPLFVYRAAMLAWALWLAFALLRWLRWGFESYTTGGLWRTAKDVARTTGA